MTPAASIERKYPCNQLLNMSWFGMNFMQPHNIATQNSFRDTEENEMLSRLRIFIYIRTAEAGMRLIEQEEKRHQDFEKRLFIED